MSGGFLSLPPWSGAPCKHYRFHATQHRHSQPRPWAAAQRGAGALRWLRRLRIQRRGWGPRGPGAYRNLSRNSGGIAGAPWLPLEPTYGEITTTVTAAQYRRVWLMIPEREAG